MSDYTALLDTISASQSQKEVTANSALLAAWPAMMFAKRDSTSSGLTWGYYGGRLNGANVGNGTVLLTASATNYIVVNRNTLAVSVATTTTNWNDTATYGRAYQVTVGTSAPSDWSDVRQACDGTGILDTRFLPLKVVSVAYAATTTVDLSNYSAYATVILDLTLTGNVTFNLTNGTDAQVIKLRVRQDGTGNRIWTSGGNLRFSSDTPSITLSTAASKLDYLSFEWCAADGKADFLASNMGR